MFDAVDPMILSLAAAAAVLVPLIMAGVHIGVVLCLAGMAGSIVYTGGNWSSSVSVLLMNSIGTASRYIFIVIPMFIALGTIAGQARITSDLFTAFSRWVGHVAGGIAVATIGTCGGLASITGSSMAASAAMTKLALPELRRFNYDDRLSAGAVAMGGTAAAMIPPSITLVLYGIFSETSIGKMLVAGVLPGVMTVILYALTISLLCTIMPSLGPAGPRFSWAERRAAVGPILPFFAIVFLVIGGILFGIWTPVESAAGGALLVLALAVWRRQMTWRKLFFALTDSAIISASVVMVVIGTLVFGNFLVLSGFSEVVTEGILALELSPLGLFCLLVGVYLVIGTMMEATATLALTIPLVSPWEGSPRV